MNYLFLFFHIRELRHFRNELAMLQVSHLLTAQAANQGPETTLRYLSAVGNVDGCVVHVPVTGPEAKPGFLGSKTQLQQIVNF